MTTSTSLVSMQFATQSCSSSSALKWHPFLSPHHSPPKTIVSFRRNNNGGGGGGGGGGDFESFKKRVASGEAWKEAWRSANDGFEQLVYDAKKAAERFDRQYKVSNKVGHVVEVASIRAREFDRDFEVSRKWQAFSMDFSRNFPRYRKQFGNFLDTPLGRGSSTLFFLWFALSGWLFRCVILATWVLPIAGPLLLNTVMNNLVVKGACPSCKRDFIGNKNSMIQCAGCGNIVWQPQGGGFSKGNKNSTRSKSQPEIIDVDFEEK